MRTGQAWIVLGQAFAGFYTATVWGIFGIMRLRRRHWWRAILDIVIAWCGVVVGFAYYALSVTPEEATPWWVRLLLIPVLVLPTFLHLSLWRETRRFLHRVEEENGR